MRFLVYFVTIAFTIQSAKSGNAKEFRICFQETEGSSQCQGSRSSCSDWSNHADKDVDASWTSFFRDDTDNRGGGCKYQWKIEENEITPPTQQKHKYRLCFKETEGSSQCQDDRSSCSGWNTSPQWTNVFRDDTDGRGGGCKYQWIVEQQDDYDAILQVDSCRVCFRELEGSSQCQGSRNSCSGWSYVNGGTGSWTSYFRDDTDGRGGGCKYVWKLECFGQF